MTIEHGSGAAVLDRELPKELSNNPSNARGNHLDSVGLLRAVREGRELLSLGSHGPEVLALQKDLNNWIEKTHPKGVGTVPENGELDQTTFEAIRAFQLNTAMDVHTGALIKADDKHHLLEDGIVGPRTMRGLDLFFHRAAEVIPFAQFQSITCGYWDISQVEEREKWRISDAATVRRKRATPFVYSPRKEDELEFFADKEAIARLGEIAEELGTKPSTLASIIKHESNFSLTAINKDTDAIGFLQWLPSTLAGMGYTTDEVRQMNRLQQLELVREYLLPYKGRISEASDTYSAVLWPKGLSFGDEDAFFRRGTRAYAYNSGLDRNGDGVVTKREATEQVRRSASQYSPILDEPIG